jgi:hypothetical protein
MKWYFTGRHILVASAISFVLAGFLTGSPVEEPSDFTIRSDVRLVLLDVNIKTHESHFVPGCQRKILPFLKTDAHKRSQCSPRAMYP